MSNLCLFRKYHHPGKLDASPSYSRRVFVSNPANYRPVCVLPTISKLLDQCVYDQVVTFLKTHNYSKTTWLMDENAISHSVDMAHECHEAYGRWPLDIPLPYPPSGILYFRPSAMWACFYTKDCIKIVNWHIMTAVVS